MIGYCYEKQWCLLEVGVQGLQAHPQKFWFAENLGKSPENPGKTGAQCLHGKHTRSYFGGYTKNKSSWFLWEKIYRQKLHKNFSGKFGEIRANFCTP